MIYSMEIARVRACNQYGLDYNPRIIPNTIRALLNGKQPIIFRGEETKRQYMYVKDLVAALEFIMESERWGPYNIGSDDTLSQSEVVNKILEFGKFNGIEPEYVLREKPQELSENMLHARADLDMPS